MSLDLKGQKCAVCSAYLFPEDDIVYCPICGAPHHRDCFKTAGHCGLQDDHGTDKEYKKPEFDQNSDLKKETSSKDSAGKKCLACGNDMDEDAHFCPKCGFGGQTQTPFQSFSPFTHAIEVKEDADIGEGVTAGEASKIVKVNPFRYIPKFLTLSPQRKGSWNWAAFLMPGAWFAYRKMYKESVFSTLLLIMSVICNLPFQMAILQLPSPDDSVRTYIELAEYYADFTSEIGLLPLAIGFAGLLLGLIIRVVCGIYGDWWYKNRVIHVAKNIRSSENADEDLRRYSGTSFIGFALALFALEMLPSIIVLFLV